MPGLLIKDMPPGLHQKLKGVAAQHHRSMTKEALAILEKALDRISSPSELPPPVKLNSPITGEWINKAKREGRE